MRYNELVTEASDSSYQNGLNDRLRGQGYTGALEVPLALLGGVANYQAIKAFLATKPGFDLNAEVNTASNYVTSFLLSRIMTNEQMIKSLKKRSTKTAALPKVAPKPAPRAVDVQEALSDLLRYVVSIKPRDMWGSYDARGPEQGNNEWTAEIRDWGKWQLPADADPSDEAYEDYDWEELSNESGAKLQSIVDDFAKRYPGVKFDWSTGEKNWIYFQAKAK